MSLKLKWHLRQVGVELLSYVVCFTTIPLTLIGVRLMKFHDYGLGMYAGRQWPKSYDMPYALDSFYQLSVQPLIWLLVLTVVADAILRRFVYRLDK